MSVVDMVSLHGEKKKKKRRRKGRVDATTSHDVWWLSGNIPPCPYQVSSAKRRRTGTNLVPTSKQSSPGRRRLRILVDAPLFLSPNRDRRGFWWWRYQKGNGWWW